MKKNRLLLLLLILVALGASTWFIASNDLIGKFFDEGDPDRPPMGAKIGLEEYLPLRIAHMDLLRGFDTAEQDSRTNSILEMEQSERELERQRRDANQPEGASWAPIGPAPIPVNASTSYSGRVSAIAVHPTNPDIVYVGTAQGGLYRSLNGGTTWTPLMDNTLTLAIGAVAISPSDPTTIFVGTGESTLCGSGCYIGVGLYRITNADTTPVISDALNKNAANADVFTGRAISEVLVHPTDPNVVFTATTVGVAGIGGTTSGAVLPALGLYRTTNAMSANPTFTKLSLGISDRSITDIVMEPANPNRIYTGVLGVAGTDGGVYSSANALDAAPTFTQLLATSATGNQSRVELAHATSTLTVYAASGQGNGSVYKSMDGNPFTLVSNTGFCNPQCFYDIAIAVDPTDANKVYLGGSPALVFGRSTNGGTSFASSSSGLHVDTQAIAVAPSNPNIVYFGSDGGIWRTTNVSASPIVWTTLNNTTFSATQFMGISVHPTDRNYTLGGTQDNGTQFLAPDGLEWIRSDGGDGGFSVIDQTAPNTTNVVAYHTYFNQSNTQIGFARALTTVPPGDPNWSQFFGCGSGAIANGIVCSDPVLFYAPMVGGPSVSGSIGNTLYFGTNKLYRSTDQGATMTVVGSAGISARISAIAIAPQNDDIRLVGTSGGAVLLQTAPGANTLTTVTGAIASSARYVGRTAIDPTNANIAYVTLNGFGLSDGRHVWKTTNLLSGSPTWVASGNGIPDTPVNAFVIDPLDTNTLYAGSDIGIFKSSDGGANWIPFNNGLPRVAVYGMAIQPTSRILRISTHGRGMYDYDLGAAPVAVNGTVTYGNAAAPPKFISNATVTGTGSPSVFTTTAAPGIGEGSYSLSGFGAGSYTVSLSKTTGQNNISSLDAARIAQHVAGVLALTSDNQKITADVSNNGTLSSNDAAFIARFVAGVGSPIGNTNQWKFYLPPGPTFPIGASPTTRTYSSVTSNIADQDFVGLLIGDVTGNWLPTAARDVTSRQGGRSVDVSLPKAEVTEGEVIIPVTIQGTANKEIIAYGFDLRYDAKVIQPQAEPVDLTGTASRGLFAVTNVIEPGLLRVVMYGAYPIDSDGLLLNLKFTAVGAPGSVSPLVFESIMFNEGDPSVITTNGQIALSAATAARQ
ncbi:MAG: hypothetical protein IPL32_02760 [Chloracidobacterium sp.]|nr:hypothetical protein [Chloracidobacterium sp.]